MILPLPYTLHFAAHGLCLGHNLCFEAWEGKDVGKEDSKDDAMKSELEKDALVLVMAKGLHLFFIDYQVFSPPILQTCTLRGCF